MKRAFSICVFSALLVFTGCRTSAEAPRPSEDPPVINGEALTPFTRPVGRNQRNFLMVVRISMVTVQIPVGSVSSSEQLWSYLDEEPIDARVGKALSVNGIRVGLGRKEAWKDVCDILQQFTGQPLSRTSLLSRPGTPMPVVFKPDQKEQTIFTFRRDESMFGQDYPPGDNVIMMMATMNYDDPSVIQMTAAPAIRASKRSNRYVVEPGGYTMKSESVYYHLGDLGFRFKVPRGGFILIGPSQEAQRPTSPGYHFLMHQRNGVEFETVVIISPEAFVAPVKEANGETSPAPGNK